VKNQQKPADLGRKRFAVLLNVTYGCKGIRAFPARIVPRGGRAATTARNFAV
jgi:hypothetical protein